MIRDDFFTRPGSRVKKAPDPGSGYATLKSIYRIDHEYKRIINASW